MYVDDFVMSGPGHNSEWESIRKVVKTTEPTEVDRVLGVHHHSEQKGTITTFTCEMKPYTKQAIGMYQAIKDHPQLKPNTNTTWHEPSNEELQNPSLTELGIFFATRCVIADEIVVHGTHDSR